MSLRTLFILAPVMLFMSCSDRIRAIPKDRLFDGKERLIYSSLEYDRFGRPVFTGPLKSKPGSVHDHYYAVDVDGKGRLVRSFQIYNRDTRRESPDVLKPLRLVFRWTGKGFMSGLDFAGEIMKAPSNSRDGAVLQMKIAGLSVIAGTAGGFTMGLLHGTGAVIDESEQFSRDNQEILVGYAKYFYDGRGRIEKIIHYTPTDIPAELVIVTFEYQNNDPEPLRTLFNSIPEKKIRTISHAKTGEKNKYEKPVR